MELDLYRGPSAHGCTIGRLAVNGHFCCWTLEDPVHDGPKMPGVTAIPAGRYPVTITRSQRFGVLLPLIQDVPGFEGIRFHAGNTAADTSGCILVGMARTPFSIMSSQVALERIQPVIAEALGRGETVWLVIHDAMQGAA